MNGGKENVLPQQDYYKTSRMHLLSGDPFLFSERQQNLPHKEHGRYSQSETG